MRADGAEGAGMTVSSIPPVDVSLVTLVTRGPALFLFVVAPAACRPAAVVPASDMTARWVVEDGLVLLDCAWGERPDRTMRLRWDLSVAERRTELAHLLDQRRATKTLAVWVCRGMAEKLVAIGALMGTENELLLRSALGWDVNVDCGPLTALPIA